MPIRLYRVNGRYATVGGAVVELRSFRRQQWWACTGCDSDGEARDLATAANTHASNCRAMPQS